MRVNDVAKLLGVSPLTVRVGLQLGFLPIGTAFKKPGSSVYTYVFYPEKLKEYLGVDSLDSLEVEDEEV